jgi:hypothetical protein
VGIARVGGEAERICGEVRRLLPFWSTRKLGTWAIDGPATASLAAGLAHAAATLAHAAATLALAIAITIAHRAPPPPVGRWGVGLRGRR